MRISNVRLALWLAILYVGSSVLWYFIGIPSALALMIFKPALQINFVLFTDDNMPYLLLLLSTIMTATLFWLGFWAVLTALRTDRSRD